jgi:hypothetical protein
VGALWLGTMSCDSRAMPTRSLVLYVSIVHVREKREYNTSTNFCLVSVPSSIDNPPVQLHWSISINHHQSCFMDTKLHDMFHNVFHDVFLC